MAEIERLLKILPTADAAGKAWQDYGEVIVCDNEDEMMREADRIASEHVQVMTRDPDYFLEQHDELRLAVPRARAPMSPMATR